MSWSAMVLLQDLPYPALPTAVNPAVGARRVLYFPGSTASVPPPPPWRQHIFGDIRNDVY